VTEIAMLFVNVAFFVARVLWFAVILGRRGGIPFRSAFLGAEK
jgi:hypothetical protein